MTNEKKPGKIGTLVLVLITMYMFHWLYILSKDQLHIVFDSYKTSGVVVSIEEHKNIRGTLKYRRVVTEFSSVIQYTDKQGIMRSFIPDRATESPLYTVGDKVELIVPEHNTTPRINTFIDIWGLISLIGVVTLLILTVSIVSIRSIIKGN